MKFAYIFCLTSILIIVSCEKSSENKIIKIDFNKLDKNADLFSKNVFDSVSYVFLDSDSSFLVGNNANLAIVDSNYYIQDPVGQLVYCFNSKGDFIRAIGKIGRGPGEYNMPTDFLVDPKTKQVEVLAYYSRKIYKYSSNGDFLGSKDGVNAYSFIKEANDNYWFCKGIAADPEIGNEQIYEIDSKGEIVRKYLPVLHTLHAGVPERSFSATTDNSILYFTQFDNRIYKITLDTIQLLLELDFGSLAYPEDLFARSPSEVMQLLIKEDHLAILNCYENHKYIYIYLTQTAVNFKYYHLLYNKNTCKMICREVERNSWENGFFKSARALTGNNELIFIADPEGYNEALKQKNSVFYQSSKPIQNTGSANNLIVKLSINL